MFFSGIADEAGKSIDAQIRAHKELGWSRIELRMVDSVNIAILPQTTFREIAKKVRKAGLQVPCFASKIGDWSRPITGDFNIDIQDLERAIPRMHHLGTRFIRVMSWPNNAANPLGEDEWRKIAIDRMKRLSLIAERSNIILAHENCSGWGGQSADNSNVLVTEVDSPALGVLFDTGNPVEYRQCSWDYYMAVRQHIVYVHIKDAKRVGDQLVYT